MASENPISVTIDPYDFFTDDFIYSDPMGVDFYFAPDYFIDDFEKNRDFYHEILWAIKDTYSVFAFVCFFANLPHLFFLTRKELRTNLVYIIMTGICICDLSHSFGKMAQTFMSWHIFYPEEKCLYIFPYYHVMIDIIAKTVQIMSRRCSGILALFIVAFRAYSVMFPMSNAINFLMKAFSGYVLVLIIGLITSGWSLVYFIATKIEKIECPTSIRPKFTPYRQITTSKEEYQFHLIDGFITACLSILYVLVTVALLIALDRANRRRKNLKSENKSNSNTSTLVVVMAISVFVSEFTYGGVFIASNMFFYKFDDRQTFDDLEILALTFAIINSLTHCFICFFMSSQYRDTVKRFVWTPKAKENKVISEPSAAHPSTVQTSKTSNLSKRTF